MSGQSRPHAWRIWAIVSPASTGMSTRSPASRAGRAPFYEPGLAELIHEGRANGRLSATTQLAPAIEQADIALICVGTPSERNGNLGLDQLRRVCSRDRRRRGRGRRGRLIVAVRSTVFPGTCDELTAACLGGRRSFRGGVEPGVSARRQRRARLPGAIAAGGGRRLPERRGEGGGAISGAAARRPAWFLCARRK